MVKKKGGREINPADAHRKAERAKEIARNKKERQLQRAALKQRDDPETLKAQLKEVIDLEHAGKMNPGLRLKKKALQQAYDLAIKRKMEEDAARRLGGRGLEEIAAEPERRPEDSVYYHSTLNPLGIPPPGKPQKYKTGSSIPGRVDTANILAPVPKQPPLPAGAAPLPPFDGPFAGVARLPQPCGSPPGAGLLALPPVLLPGAAWAPPLAQSGQPPGSAVLAPLPPPPGPPPGSAVLAPLPPPPGRPPGSAGLALLALPGLPGAASMLLPPRQRLPPVAATTATARATAQDIQQPMPPPPMPPPQMPSPSRPMSCGIIARPADVRLPPMLATVVHSPLLSMPPAACLDAGQQQRQHRKLGQGPVISGKSTVVPLPKAQEDKTVTAMIPASVRVQREQAQTRVLTKEGAPSAAGFGLAPSRQQAQRPAPPIAEGVPASVDEKVKMFLESLDSMC